MKKVWKVINFIIKAIIPFSHEVIKLIEKLKTKWKDK